MIDLLRQTLDDRFIEANHLLIDLLRQTLVDRFLSKIFMFHHVRHQSILELIFLFFPGKLIFG